MEAYTLTLLTHSLTDSLICPHNGFLSHLKVIPGFEAGYIYMLMKGKLSFYYLNFFLSNLHPLSSPSKSLPTLNMSMLKPYFIYGLNTLI